MSSEFEHNQSHQFDLILTVLFVCVTLCDKLKIGLVMGGWFFIYYTILWLQWSFLVVLTFLSLLSHLCRSQYIVLAGDNIQRVCTEGFPETVDELKMMVKTCLNLEGEMKNSVVNSVLWTTQRIYTVKSLNWRSSWRHHAAVHSPKASGPICSPYPPSSRCLFDLFDFSNPLFI